MIYFLSDFLSFIMQVHSAINSQLKLICARRLETRVDFPFFCAMKEKWTNLSRNSKNFSNSKWMSVYFSRPGEGQTRPGLDSFVSPKTWCPLYCVWPGRSRDKTSVCPGPADLPLAFLQGWQLKYFIRRITEIQSNGQITVDLAENLIDDIILCNEGNNESETNAIEDSKVIVRR